MKWMLCLLIAYTAQSFADNHQNHSKKVQHDKEHQHVDKGDHEHDDGHHKEHDHKAHHPTHDQDVKKKVEEKKK